MTKQSKAICYSLLQCLGNDIRDYLVKHEELPNYQTHEFIESRIEAWCKFLREEIVDD